MKVFGLLSTTSLKDDWFQFFQIGLLSEILNIVIWKFTKCAIKGKGLTVRCFDLQKKSEVYDGIVR
jgi:hypothetical protein